MDLTAQIGHFKQDTNRGKYGIDGGTVSEANEWYHQLTSASDPSDSTATIPGVRYVYNVADTLLPDYNGAKMFIGFDNQANGTKSVLCNGDDASTITAQGFLPLTTGPRSAPTGSDAAGATCREFSGLASRVRVRSIPGRRRPSTAEAPKHVLAPVVRAVQARTTGRDGNVVPQPQPKLHDHHYT